MSMASVPVTSTQRAAAEEFSSTESLLEHDSDIYALVSRISVQVYQVYKIKHDGIVLQPSGRLILNCEASLPGFKVLPCEA